MKPLAITGLGVVSPIGIGRAPFRQALDSPSTASERAFGRTPTFAPAEVIPGAHVAEVWDFDPSEYLGAKGHRNFDRLTKFLIVAAKHALEDAGLKREGQFVQLDALRIGVCSATGYGSLDAITELNRVAELEDPRYINPTRFPNTVINSSAGYVSIWEDLRAPNTTIVDGNCGALDAVLSSETHLANGRADAFLVGGGEILSEPLYVAFRKLGVLAETRQGDGGLTLGEGAVYCCVERLSHATARGANILAKIVGYGTAFEPPASEARIVHSSADAVARAIRGALADAGLTAADVDAVASSLGGLEEIDRPERAGIAMALGADVAVATPKSIYGETFGAGGALGIATALGWLDGAPVGPVTSGTVPDEIRTVLVTAVGFYGNVSAVVLQRADLPSPHEKTS